MKIRVHADDIGLTRGVTESILACADHGALDSASLMATGAGFEHAVAALRARPELHVAVHLNLREGRPLRPGREVPLLTDASGCFAHSFFSLWARYLRWSPTQRRDFAEQARVELRAQIERVLEATGRGAVGLDSHGHLHMLPFVFEQVAELAPDYPIDHVRLPREPFFLTSLRDAPSYAGANLGRHALLKALSRPAARRLAAAGLPTSDWFVGLLLQGRMTADALESALARIARRTPDASVEVAFHPGGAPAEEAELWEPGSHFRAFYRSAARDREAETLRDPALASVVARFRAA